MARLLAIDGLNIVRRVYEASPEPDSDLKADIALRHALSSFRTLINDHEPTHVLPAFDFGGPTWRHALYAGYREGRQPMPQVLRDALPGFYDTLASFGLHVVTIPEVEADDVIGTAVTRWLHQGRGAAVIATTDKDLHGLIAQGALVWDHFKGEWHDAAWVERKFGVPPEQLPDLLALMGDATDSIPGVSKVGLKTGAKLLRAYGSLDAVMAGAGILPGQLGESLRKDREILYLSRQLVQLKTDVLLGVTWNKLAWDKP
ncbi:5'-3' exonuclease [Janthinobacterium agaricidamnosum]|uniref:5'-3' exonuclease, C-terminal SAM fold family protein n=1 Tax=Janthinobacterium agaricidamnosum NBRC 102515 = DSM 9628 TaxID=1349767 RepID=W0V175_9BURK|nr:5'-3' exonuclease H3TH domain-containing protein [Janthinobacterium agaricidamnosum]CDG81022.1 5'-3' exonuclease, C-terminal SAM fold family protein [Janthinobacterium agaricidamnosum NBRC 102515 = DSM 9628]